MTRGTGFVTPGPRRPHSADNCRYQRVRDFSRVRVSVFSSVRCERPPLAVVVFFYHCAPGIFFIRAYKKNYLPVNLVIAILVLLPSDTGPFDVNSDKYLTVRRCLNKDYSVIGSIDELFSTVVGSFLFSTTWRNRRTKFYERRWTN